MELQNTRQWNDTTNQRISNHNQLNSNTHTHTKSVYFRTSLAPLGDTHVFVRPWERMRQIKFIQLHRTWRLLGETPISTATGPDFKNKHESLSQIGNVVKRKLKHKSILTSEPVNWSQFWNRADRSHVWNRSDYNQKKYYQFDCLTWWEPPCP